MKNQICSIGSALLVFLLLTEWSNVEAQTCKASGKIRGEKAPHEQCNKENDADCCMHDKSYTIYKCSPPVSSHTKAKLTINSFEKGGDGGGPSECDNKYHSNNTPVTIRICRISGIKNSHHCSHKMSAISNPNIY
ncbi:hypothetical protein I3760_01G054700 [Carya illinoinensis]|nr:hypothetical protein I3760_01G054700 [Carya illinoinensis]